MSWTVDSTPEPSSTHTGIYYTTQEVSELLGGIQAKALIEKRKNKAFPDPVSKNGSGNLYLKKDVNEWMEKKGLQ